MKIFSKKDKLSSLVRTDFSLLPVINRFGIKLGFKDKTIEQVCSEKGIELDFFLTIINTYSNSDFFPEKKLLSFSPLLIVEYLGKTHQYYIEYVFPKIESLLSALIDSGQSNKEQLHMIQTFYLKYKKEWLQHIKEEEDELFPYVKQIIESPDKIPENASIRSYEKEHINVDDKLNDLTNLIIKYIEPVYDNNICNEFLQLLAAFEKDSKDHARIEDKILLEQIVEIEKKKNAQ